MKKIFIDGRQGTTGLKIFDRLEHRNDIELLTLSNEERKDVSKRKKMLNLADYVFLCLPDEEAINAVSLIENENVIVFDTSTAHRTAYGWAYGFPELGTNFLNDIINGKRIAVPGCHASGIIALIYPLIQANILDSNSLITAFSLTGYSGGGKKMIAEYESDCINELYKAPRQYGINQNHKHLKEITKICNLKNAPCFTPIVSNFFSGMEVTIPLFKTQLKGEANIDFIKNIYKKYYSNSVVLFNDNSDENGFVSAGKLSGKDNMEISVFGNDERIILVARYDNLGKGASGAAIECLNIKMNLPISFGLNI